MKRPFLLAVAVLASCGGPNPKPVVDDAPRWAQWRGPLGNGVAPDAHPPLEWSEDRNVRWKVEVPGRGHSTPAVWGDRIFLTTAVGGGEELAPSAGHRRGGHDNFRTVRRQEFRVLALSRKDGSTIWNRTVRRAAPHEGGHVTSSFASASPVTDGERIYAFFGSQGLFCLDWNGKTLWEKDLGDMHTKHGHGEGSSPVLHGETLVVNWDHEGPSFIVAFDKRTGRERWRKKRNEPSSWSSPIVVEHAGRAQVIVSGRSVRGYDLKSGDVIWECGGLSHNVTASPVSSAGIVYAGCSYELKAMLAIRLEGAKGDITGSKQVLWNLRRSTPYVPSPLLYQGRLYFLKHYQGILMCLEAESGRVLWGPTRLPGIRNVYASIGGAGGRVYITSMDGATAVLDSGDAFKVLAVNRLDDAFSASPAFVGDDLLLRGEKHLYCLSTR